MNTVNRVDFSRAVKEHEIFNVPVETDQRSVMQCYDYNSVMFASAEYVRVVGGTVHVTYRVREDYLHTGK